MTHKKGLATLLSAIVVVGASVVIARYLAVSDENHENLFANAPSGQVIEPEWPTHTVDLGAGEPSLAPEPLPTTDPNFIAPVMPSNPVETSKPAPPKTKGSKPETVNTPMVQKVQTPAYWVQAGSYSSLARANAAREALLVLGLAGTINTITHEDKLYYRLRFGAWEVEAEAARFRDYLKDTENLRLAFNELKTSDRSNDFADAYVVVSTLQKVVNVVS